MKINCHDQAKILSPQEIAWLFDGKLGLVSDLKLLRLLVWVGKEEGEAGASLLPKAIAFLSLLSHIKGLPTERDRALFGICLYTTARINEACLLNTADVYGADGRVRDRITFRRATTKGKQETRSVPVSPELRELLTEYRSKRPYLFPGLWGRGHLCPESADAILRASFRRLEIEGASTHSFRRTAITWMHNERVPIKHIQSISGHKSLSALQRYIDVTEKEGNGDRHPQFSILGTLLIFLPSLSILIEITTYLHERKLLMPKFCLFADAQYCLWQY